MSGGQILRLAYIDARLVMGECVNRSDLVEAFGISGPQASNDFAEFRRRFPDRMRYDVSLKTYQRKARVPAFSPAQRVAAIDVVRAFREFWHV